VSGVDHSNQSSTLGRAEGDTCASTSPFRKHGAKAKATQATMHASGCSMGKGPAHQFLLVQPEAAGAYAATQ